MVVVEDLLGLDQVELLLGLVGPRQAHEPVEVGADDARLGARRRHLLEAAELLERLLLDGLGHARDLDLLGVLVDLGLHLVELPSSCWIALSCSRKKYSRCDLVICSLTRLWILLPSSRISSSLRRKRAALLEALLRLERLEDLLLLLDLEVEVEG